MDCAQVAADWTYPTNVIPAPTHVIPAPSPVIPAPSHVIPAKAGIQCVPSDWTYRLEPPSAVSDWNAIPPPSDDHALRPHPLAKPNLHLRVYRINECTVIYAIAVEPSPARARAGTRLGTRIVPPLRSRTLSPLSGSHHHLYLHSSGCVWSHAAGSPNSSIVKPPSRYCT